VYDQGRAILLAQFRTLRNFVRHSGRFGVWFTIAVSVVWYGMWLFGAAAVGLMLRSVHRPEDAQRILGPGLLLTFLYWQLVPVLMASTGATLNLRKLQVYPIPISHLFGLEALLRITTAGEVMLMLAGTAVGLWLNPRLPAWTVLPLVPFALLNLFLSVGVRDLLARLLARRRVREIVVLLFVIAAAAPQLVLLNAKPSWLIPLERVARGVGSPWGSAAQLASGVADPTAWLTLGVWTLAALAFGRWQFLRSLRFDEEAARATVQGEGLESRVAWVYRIPSRFLKDPLGAMVEKELRALVRSPRFRLLFIMGFSFGLMVWLPMSFRRGPQGMIGQNFLIFVCLYAVMLLGEVTVWNTFGFDRSAAAVYFCAPTELRDVLIAKNITAVIFVSCEILLIHVICAILRLPMAAGKIAEAAGVTLLFTALTIGVGNFSSVYYPRAVDPNQSWRSAAAGRTQALLLVVYPVTALPLALAYAARYFSGSGWVFAMMLGLTALVAGALYAVSLERASAAARRRSEEMLRSLGEGASPVES
jgi:ABC-2 type transport system permease protein